MINVRYEHFFDRKGITDRIDAATRRVLSKAGAFVRTAARGLIRSRNTVAEPGNPPHSHTGLLKSLIFFQYEPETKTVVIGPKKFKSQNPTSPQVLEFGGKGNNGKTYHPFPFMRPALEGERDKFPELFANAVK